MNSLNILIGAILAWPILSLLAHIILVHQAYRARQRCQSLLMIGWLVLSLLLLVVNDKPYAIMMGSWSAPFGIALVFDRLSCLMLFIFAIVSTSINWYSYQDKALANRQQAFYAGFWLLQLGLTCALCTADIFNLYVWFEVMLVSAFILLASTNKPKTQAMMYYALINITGTLIMLLAIALIYGVFGTLSYAGIANDLQQTNNLIVLPILILLLFAIGLKGAIFPLYFWLPKAYSQASDSSIMLLSSLVTKVVMVVLLRLVWLWLPLQSHFINQLLLVIALCTMFLGVMGAANQFHIKNILAFHIISQLGYILLAIVLPTPLAVVAAIYFVIHNIFVKTNLFMVAGIIEQHMGTGNLNKLGHLLKHHRWLAAAFFVPAVSLAGFPPLSGFWAKLLVIQSALSAHYYFSTAVAIGVSLFTLYSMIKIWRYVFCEEPTSAGVHIGKPLPFSINVIIAILPLLVLPLVMGIWPDTLLNWLKIIPEQLHSSTNYINLVLGGGA